MILITVLAVLLVASPTSAKTCKAVYGEPSWPSADKWAALSTAVGGRLEKVIPPAAACHSTYEGQSTYNSAQCTTIRRGWSDQMFHSDNPVSMHYDIWTNGTCGPTTNRGSACTHGLYPRYVVKATTPQDVQAGVNFARENNIRLVVKNTGHDFNGRSIGAHSLSIWTHQFKDMEIIDNYSDPSTSYTGSAVRLGAGWQVGETYAALDKIGKTIVAGECKTVGLAGGYIQGGGHGPMSTLHGLASDNVLSFNLVTPGGEIITADASQNTDYFYALRGGGGGTFGIVTQLVVKTHPTPKIAALTLRFSSSASSTAFWAGVAAFHAASVEWSKHGIFVYYEISSFMGFSMKPLIAPNKTRAELEVILRPFFSALAAAGTRYSSTYSEHATLNAAYIELFDGEPTGSSLNMYVSGRLIHGAHVTGSANDAVTAAHRRAVMTDRKMVVGHLVAPGVFGGVGEDTGVNAAWKDTVLFPMFVEFWSASDSESSRQTSIRSTNAMDAAMKSATPGSGGYANEGNMFDPDWKQVFYGAKYERLLDIKRKVDPTGLLYTKTGVGSEEWWEEAGGRLCTAA